MGTPLGAKAQWLTNWKRQHFFLCMSGSMSERWNKHTADTGGALHSVSITGTRSTWTGTSVQVGDTVIFLNSATARESLKLLMPGGITASNKQMLLYVECHMYRTPFSIINERKYSHTYQLNIFRRSQNIDTVLFQK